MYCVGLTGSVACGKSTVARCFASLGVDIISADQIARDLVAPNQPALQHIITHFGSSVLTPSGELDRRALRDLMVEDEDARRWLEHLLHPLIRECIQQKVSQSKARYCLIEIPLLTDRTDYSYLNRVLLVDCEEELQINRLMARDNCSRKNALALLMITQKDQGKRHMIANDVIVNTESMTVLHEHVLKLHEYYLSQITGVTNELRNNPHSKR